MDITEGQKENLLEKDKVELVLNVTEKPNSYECGKAGNRHKVYYGDQADLRRQLDGLIAMGLLTKEEVYGGAK